MRFVVQCHVCHVDAVAECFNGDDAKHVANRHNTLTGHEATVRRVLDTPLEGLI